MNIVFSLQKTLQVSSLFFGVPRFMSGIVDLKSQLNEMAQRASDFSN